MFSLASDNDNLGNFYLEDTALTKKKQFRKNPSIGDSDEIVLGSGVPLSSFNRNRGIRHQNILNDLQFRNNKDNWFNVTHP